MENNSRRSFFKNLAGLTGAALFVPQLFSSVVMAEEQRRAKKDAGNTAGGTADLNLPLVEPGKGIAAGLNYQLKHEDLKDAALKVDRNGVPFDKQFCSSCMLYKTVGKKDGEEVGKCTLFPNQLVKSTSWCATWQKKV